MSRSKKFVDRLRLLVKAGDGAPGNPSIKGKGGNGGSIYLKADANYSLSKFMEDYNALSGKPPSAKLGYSFGVDGRSIYLKVPTGVTVHASVNQNSNNQPIIGDLDSHNQKLLVARGGVGGIPLTNYIPTSGQKHILIIDHKLISDIGFVGFPNAGKSSLLRALTGVKAKIASYPFTTLKPQKSAIRYDDGRLIELTDLPGLADIAAKYDHKKDVIPPLHKAGFLKHLERNKCIMVVIDSQGFQENQNAPWRNISDSALLLASQLERFSFGCLVNKPVICVINKIDLCDNTIELDYIKEHFLSGDYVTSSSLPKTLMPRYPFLFEDIYTVSAKENTNISELKNGIRNKLDDIAREVLAKKLNEDKDGLNIEERLHGKLPIVV